MNGNVETTCWTSVDDVDQVGGVYTRVIGGAVTARVPGKTT